MVRWARWLGLAVALLAVGRARAMEVWTPETGEVQLDGLPRTTTDEQRRHALALLAAGEVVAGTAQLRQLIAAEPDAEWVPEARLAIARALVADGRYKDAFEEVQPVTSSKAPGELVTRARAAQMDAARREEARDVDRALALHERMFETARDRDEEAEVQKEMADALFRAARYMDAEAEYRNVVDFYPTSIWVPYCWYRAAECEWRLAEWLGLGLERYELAGQHMADFLDRYPGDPRTADAQRVLREAQAQQARLNAEIARYYSGAARRPWAAQSYLQYIREEFPDSQEARWAEAQLSRGHAEAACSPDGAVRELRLPGVVTAEQAAMEARE